jgi:hypothetical protein|tara:strand:- start:1508 stop:1723 length:216 start_codon:yes stop_codon:yes gene_type:complete
MEGQAIMALLQTGNLLTEPIQQELEKHDPIFSKEKQVDQAGVLAEVDLVLEVEGQDSENKNLYYEHACNSR